ncbi:MAG TPA: hypothetical protein VKV19_02250 [Ktedonobacteraceae bacterium]|nr:hypothetical protein [Ktedonobacteraceae bacterium]
MQPVIQVEHLRKRKFPPLDAGAKPTVGAAGLAEVITAPLSPN